MYYYIVTNTKLQIIRQKFAFNFSKSRIYANDILSYIVWYHLLINENKPFAREEGGKSINDCKRQLYLIVYSKFYEQSLTFLDPKQNFEPWAGKFGPLFGFNSNQIVS